MEWCRAIWAGETRRLRPEFATGPEESVVAMAHCIAHGSRAKSWEECRVQLETLRVVAGHVDVEWLV